jgi:hypothetical protein
MEKLFTSKLRIRKPPPGKPISNKLPISKLPVSKLPIGKLFAIKSPIQQAIYK